MPIFSLPITYCIFSGSPASGKRSRGDKEQKGRSEEPKGPDDGNKKAWTTETKGPDDGNKKDRTTGTKRAGRREPEGPDDGNQKGRTTVFQKGTMMISDDGLATEGP